MPTPVFRCARASLCSANAAPRRGEAQPIAEPNDDQAARDEQSHGRDIRGGSICHSAHRSCHEEIDNPPYEDDQRRAAAEEDDGDEHG